MFAGTKYADPLWYTQDPGYDPQEADRAVRFFEEYLVHTKGRWRGSAFVLLPWQEHRIIRPLFGIKNPATGKRRYRRCYVEVPKKNGKSEVGAGVALFLLNADREPSAEVYSAAGDKEQASIVFDVALQMTSLSAPLHKRSRVRPSTKRIIIPKKNNLYRVLSSDVPTKHGFNVHGTIFDELHTQPNDELWKVLTKASGEAREQPLTFSITTAGNNKRSVCGIEHDYALRIQRGELDNDTILPVIYFLENDEDWEDEENWKKVNPSMGRPEEGAIFGIDRMREMYREAKEKPSEIPTFRRLRLDQWTAAISKWIREDAWKRSAGAVDLEELKGRPCFGGLDLSSGKDLTAWILVFPFDNGTVKILGRFWIPEVAIEDRTKNDGVPYRHWAENEWIIPCPGPTISQRMVEQQIKQDGETYRILEIMYDRWNSDYIIENLRQEGFTMVPIGQGFASMTAPSKLFETLYLEGRLHHGNDPVINWAAENVAIESDAAENIKPTKDKDKSGERIDPIVATIMALDGYRRRVEQTEKSVYETRGLRTIGESTSREDQGDEANGPKNPGTDHEETDRD